VVTARRVVVGGAINTDLVARTPRYPEQGETITGSGFAVYGGGKGANQAVAAARSGGHVSIVGGVGDDAFGRDRVADLNAEGIDTGAVVVSPDHPSGVAMIAVEPGGDNRIIYVPGATLAVRPETAMAALGDEPIGVLLLTLELDDAVIDALIQRARRDGSWPGSTS
jgi:ribokinase